MAYRYGDRKQRTLFPQSIDEYIAQDAPVRAYDVFVDSLNLAELGIEIEPHKEGVKAEASVLASCFNIARMISIVGVAGLITKLGS